MSSLHLLVEMGFEPNTVRVSVSGPPPPEKPFFSMNLSEFSEVREDFFFFSLLTQGEAGSPFSSEMGRVRDGSVYCAYICCNETRQSGSFPNPDNIALKQCFRISENKIVLLSELEEEAARKKLAELNLLPLYADDGCGSSAKRFEIVFFFAGVNIHFASAMKGVSLIPVAPGLSNSSALHAVSDYLLSRHGVKIPDGEGLKSWLRFQPVFAMNFHEVVAATEDSAFRFSKRIAHDFSTIIAIDRGYRPFHMLTFVLDIENGSWRAVPTNFDINGNLLPPFSQNGVSERIEGLYPLIQSKPYARLVLELYVQSLAERDKSFCYFKQWSLLEMISDKRIAASNTPLRNLDNSIIVLSDGKPLTTKRKDGKVYAYLRSANLPPIYQRGEDGVMIAVEGSLGCIDSGGGVVSLWDTVAAYYNIRNKVAHEGRFDENKNPANFRDKLCLDFYTGRLGFMDFVLLGIVMREIAIG